MQDDGHEGGTPPQPGALRDEGRMVLRLSGADAREMLQGLVTNDMRRLAPGVPVYAALLSPQGKYLFDFILVEDADGSILLDVAEDRARALAQRLTMYRLRKAVEISATDLGVGLLWGDAPQPDLPGAALRVPDPRDPGLGLRLYADPGVLAALPADAAAHAARTALCIARAVPETGTDLRPDETFILEAGFERLHGVDFRKGCFVGQEVTARMKHKTELRRGLVPVRITGRAMPGDEILADGKRAGTLGAVCGDRGLALLRLDRAGGEMQAGEATLVRGT